MATRRTVLVWIALVSLIAFACGESETVLSGSAVSSTSEPVQALDSTEQSATRPDPSNVEPWTTGEPTALQQEMTKNGSPENVDGSLGRSIWIPADRAGIPNAAIEEWIRFSDGYFELAVPCQEHGFAITWSEDGFELIRPALSPTGGRLPTSLIDFTCSEDEELGIVSLPAKSGDFVNVTLLDDERYELSSNGWKLTVQRDSL